MDKPKVDEIRGIPPAIAIEQSNPVKSTRSTVGTMTEINDYLKVLLPRVVTAHCPECARPIRPETAKSIVEQVFAQHAGESVLVTFGVPASARNEARGLLRLPATARLSARVDRRRDSCASMKRRKSSVCRRSCR